MRLFRRIPEILLVILVSVISLLALVYALLWIPSVQQGIKDLALTELMKKTGNRIDIGRLSLRPFNRLLLEDLYVSDLRGDTLLYADRLSAGFKWMPLLKKQLLIQSVDLDRFTVHARKDSLSAPFNFQFLIDAFASKDTTLKSESEGIAVEIDRVRFSRGTLSYDILSELAAEDSLLDFNHIYINDLETEVSLRSIDIESLDAGIKHLSFKERSGLSVDDLQAQLVSRGKKIELKQLELVLPSSRLSLTEGNLDYTGFELDNLTEGATYSFDLKLEPFHPSDLRSLYAPLAAWTDSLRFEVRLSGKFPSLDLNPLILDYGNRLSLRLDARLENINDWKYSDFRLDLQRVFLNSAGVKQLMSLASAGKSEKKDEPLRIPGQVEISGNLRGSLPDFGLLIKAEGDNGKLDLKGQVGYLYDNGRAHFDLQADARDFDLRTLMQGDTLFDKASFSFAAKGKLSESGRVDADGSLSVDRLDYNRYAFHELAARFSYHGDSARVNLVSTDPNLPLELEAAANLHPKRQAATVFARLAQVQMHALNLTPNYPGAELFARIRAEVSGFDPERMEAALRIDSLRLRTDEGIFADRSLLANYTAGAEDAKLLTVESKALRARMEGHFVWKDFQEATVQTLRNYVPNLFPAEGKKQKKQKEIASDWRFYLALKETQAIAQTLALPAVIPDSAVLRARFNSRSRMLDTQIKIPRFKLGDMPLINTFLSLKADSIEHRMQLLAGTDREYDSLSDTAALRLNVHNLPDSGLLAVVLNGVNRTSDMDMSGGIDAVVNFMQNPKRGMPDLEVLFNQTTLRVNGEQFTFQPARVLVEEDRYTIDHFAVAHTDTEYLKIDGVVSALPEDTLNIDLSHFRLQTLMNALNRPLNLGGEANGRVVLTQLLTTPFLLTEGFSVQDITLEQKKIGTLKLVSAWNSADHGLYFKADLTNPGLPGSTLSGYALPREDSLVFDADIQGIMLDWLSPFTEGMLYGLDGQLGAKLRARGGIKTPDLRGTVYFKDARLGVKMFNTEYKISDSIYIEPGRIDFRDFVIWDQKKKPAIVRGQIKHKQFADLNPDLRVSFDNFLVVNNQANIDSLFYGTLGINGQLRLSRQKEGLQVNATLTHSADARIMVNLPESSAEAQQYNSITFVRPKEEDNRFFFETDSSARVNAPPSLPVKLNVSLSVRPDMTLGAIINPVTRDAVQVTGSGIIDFSYDLNTSAMSLLGDYTVKDGKCTLSLRNITRKTFFVQEGGKLSFAGDPLATTFNVTAVYALKADLSALDPSFSEVMTASTKVPVNCLLTASGSLKKMELKYGIDLPDNKGDVQRKVDGLLYTDDIKIREIAYLLAFNTFMPVNSEKGSGPSIWTSLASSSITSQLNNLLSGVLSENWTIGTELHSGEDGLSDLEMDVNVSTRLFNDRLTFNSTIGYRNFSGPASDQNFTGDFDVQYKLNRPGNLILKVYNVTNTQYYETARTTQGVGIVYKKESRTFKGLFKRFKAMLQ